MITKFDPQRIDAICSGFQKARILLSAAELDLFSNLREGTTKSVHDLCETHGWSPRGLEILMDSLVAMGYLTKNGSSYSVDQQLSELLDSESDKSILPLIRHRVRMWNSWSNLTAIVRGDFDFESYFKAARSREDIEAFIGAMEVVGRDRALAIAKDINLGNRTSLLDVGAGSGIYSRALLELNPELRATLFDLPLVVDITTEKISDSEWADRINFVKGDFKTDPLPSGHDIVLLSAIIHMNGREGNQQLFSKAHACLNPNGLIIIRDHVMEESRVAPEDGAIFAVNMLVATREGSTYTFKEISEDLALSGFHDIQLLRGGSHMDQVVTALK